MSKWGIEEHTVIEILNEITRILKKEGILILDFATQVSRFDKSGNKVMFQGEGNYSNEGAIHLLKENLKGFEISIKKSSFKEENLEDGAGYQSIEGDFLIICGTKKEYVKTKKAYK